jgi:hypothetical protein
MQRRPASGAISRRRRTAVRFPARDKHAMFVAKMLRAPRFRTGHRKSMKTEQHLKQYLESGVIPAALDAALGEPSARRGLYRSIVNGPIHPFRQLLLRLLEKEVSFREALWEGDVEDDEDYFEGIYHCAFLLSRCGDPSDAAALWKAQHLNQDIGEMDVGNFVGAGVAETLSFLDRATDEVSQEIARYIRGSLNHPEAVEWLKSWDKRCRENIRGA